MKIELPPLNERRDDIPLLINRFIEKFNHKMGKNILGISSEVLSLLMRYKYSGNIRELENIIEHAMVMCSNEELLVEHLPDEVISEKPGNKNVKTSEEPLQQTECNTILASLKKNDWNKNKVAEELKIHRTTLWRKMKKHGIF